MLCAVYVQCGSHNTKLYLSTNILKIKLNFAFASSKLPRFLRSLSGYNSGSTLADSIGTKTGTKRTWFAQACRPSLFGVWNIPANKYSDKLMTGPYRPFYPDMPLD